MSTLGTSIRTNRDDGSWCVESAAGALAARQRAACAFLDDVGAIQDAFGIRTNAVNFKKVLLRVLYETEALELRLRRLLTYYRGDMHKDGGYRGARFRETWRARTVSRRDEGDL